MQSKFGWCSDPSLSYQRKCFYSICFRMKMGPQNERGWLLCTHIETNKSRGIAWLKRNSQHPPYPHLLPRLLQRWKIQWWALSLTKKNPPKRTPQNEKKQRTLKPETNKGTSAPTIRGMEACKLCGGHRLCNSCAGTCFRHCLWPLRPMGNRQQF